MREGRWEKATRITRDAEGLALGIVGYGAIGSKVARFADAFGVRVMAYDPYLPGDGLPGPGERVADLPSLLARSEALSLHCPLSDETRGMIGAAQFAAMPQGSLLVNAARGGIVDEAALLAAIEAGQIAAAGHRRVRHGAAAGRQPAAAAPARADLAAPRGLLRAGRHRHGDGGGGVHRRGPRGPPAGAAGGDRGPGRAPGGGRGGRAAA